jgi:membrane-associated phospholipid phosphatase
MAETRSHLPGLRPVLGIAAACAAPALFLQAWTPLAVAAAVAILGVSTLRLARRAPIGVPPLAGIVALAGVAAFWVAWTFGHASLFSAAEHMRSTLPFIPEHVMRRLPGNDPVWAPRPLGDPVLRPVWTVIYLGGWLTMPLLALPWCALQGRSDATMRIGWSHLTCCALALPVFVLLPIPDPWWDAGWLGGLRAPPWWSGMAAHVVTCCFPSMHVAVATTVAIAASREAPRLERAAWWTWVVIIALSTLAVHTHWLVDLPAGAGVGWLADRLLGRLIAAARLGHWLRPGIRASPPTSTWPAGVLAGGSRPASHPAVPPARTLG